MAVVGDYHFPCIIYMREQGNPIGKIDENVRLERQKWMNNTDCYKDPICKHNCLDVCVEYNNKYIKGQILKQTKVKKLDSTLFTFDKWEDR